MNLPNDSFVAGQEMLLTVGGNLDVKHRKDLGDFS